MAAYGPAISRVKYVLGRGPYQGTPATISGGDGDVFSYAKRIVTRRDSFSYLVTSDGSTRTTNRHIRAAGMALYELGYRLVDADSDGHCIYRKDG